MKIKTSVSGSTRDELARLILESGPMSAPELADRLKLTAAGIRRHLDALTDEGILEAREPYRVQNNARGRGRPSKVFVMTDVGREKFEHSYDDLAVQALKFMAVNNGPQMVREFAHARAQEIARKVQQNLERHRAGKTQKDKMKSLAQALNDEGYASSIHNKSQGDELCQHHCPVAHVAAEFPELCEAETQVFSQVLGTHVQRLATIAHGDGVCTTFIPKSHVPKSHVPKSEPRPSTKKKVHHS